MKKQRQRAGIVRLVVVGSAVSMVMGAISPVFSQEIFSSKSEKGGRVFSDTPPGGYKKPASKGPRYGGEDTETSKDGAGEPSKEKATDKKLVDSKTPSGKEGEKPLTKQEEAARKKKEAQEKEEKRKEEEKRLAEREQYCRDLRKNLASLESARRLSETDEEGRPRRMGRDQREAEAEKARAAMEKHCADR